MGIFIITVICHLKISPQIIRTGIMFFRFNKQHVATLPIQIVSASVAFHMHSVYAQLSKLREGMTKRTCWV